MKNIILKDDFREYEIRPVEEFEKYLNLIQKDLAKIFDSNAGNYFYYCPACESRESIVKFSKNLFIYRECSNCSTLFLSPRPTKDMLHDFFDKSEGLKYWNSKIVQETSSRKTHVFNPRVRWVLDACAINGLENETYCDLYTKYIPYVGKVTESGTFSKYLSYKNIAEINGFLTENKIEQVSGREDIPAQSISVITAFEVFDRFYNPNTMMDFINYTLKSDGLLFITTTSASGIDLQVLKEKSRSLIPPIHLNIFSVEGIIIFLEKHNFEIIELSTPGSLDTSIITNAIKSDPGIEVPKYLKDIALNRNDDMKQAFQEYLQRALLSSHLRIVARKK